MAVQTNITVTHGGETIGTIKSKFCKDSSLKFETLHEVENFLSQIAVGTRRASFTTQVTSGDEVYATGTFTFSTHATAADTLSVGGVTFTAETSGATGNQFNIGSTATSTATAFAAAINGSATAAVKGSVTATSAAGVVTVKAIYPGNLGNFFTISVTSCSAATASGSTLASGAMPATIDAGGTYHFGA